jgi:hypothetical protein
MSDTSTRYAPHAATVAAHSKQVAAKAVQGWLVDSLLPNPGMILALEQAELQTA